MLSLFGKASSFLWNQIEYLNSEPAIVSEDHYSDSDDELHECHVLTQDLYGKVTHLNPSERFGLLNGDIYFSYDAVCDTKLPSIGIKVTATVEKLKEEDPWKATRVILLEDCWDDEDTNNCKKEIKYNNPDASIGVVASIKNGFLEFVDGNKICLKDIKCEEFKPFVGDVVQFSLEGKELRPSRIREVDGVVTRNNPDGTGTINHEVWFDSSVCMNNYRPRRGNRVVVQAIESHQLSLMWRAAKVVPKELPKTIPSNAFLMINKSPVQCNFLQRLISDKAGISITSPLDFGIIFLDVKGYITAYINNSGENAQNIQNVRFQRKCAQFTLGTIESAENSKAESSSEKFVLLPGCSAYLNIYCKVSQLGKCKELLLFDFEGFQIGRHVCANVKHPVQDSITHSTANGKPHRYYQQGTLLNQKEECILPGEKPLRTKHYLQVSLPNFTVPEKMRMTVLNHGDILSVSPSLTKDLLMDNYFDQFSALLHLEEIQGQIEMEQYIMRDVCLSLMGSEFLSLQVPGLAEGRPSLLIGDKVYLRSPDGEPGPVYQGFIHEVLKDNVLIKFHSSFHTKYYGESYDVSFEFSRTGMRRCHQAVKQAQSLVCPQTLFPSDMKIKPPIYQLKGKLNYFNLHLNFEQKSAVLRILGNQCRPLPYIIFGPPGTGKTVTLVEAVLQVFTLIKSSRVIVCAPTNSAADLITMRLQQSGAVSVNDMARLNAFQRNPESIQECIQQYCFFGDTDLSKVAYHRIIVSTCSTIGILYGMKLNTGHFTHLFLDEAGQATEPECLVAMELVTCMGNEGQIILAGDPKQLGPVLRSDYAKFYGLQQSFLERLMMRRLYCRDTDKFANHGNYDPLLVTKLVKNYRSLAPLLKLYSDLFYESELQPYVQNVCPILWNALPNKEFPILFHGIAGEEVRESDSPSWFNPAEVMQIITYLQELYELHFKAEDIGIITPYRKQVEKVRFLSESLGFEMCKIGSVEEFQGQERKIIILSTVRCSKSDFMEHANPLGFVSQPKRFNVAISRAQILLIIIGDPNLLNKDDYWRAILKYCVDNHAYIGCEIDFI